MHKLTNFFINKLPGWITVSGAGAVIANAGIGYAQGQTPGREALFQGIMGVIAIGLRRALARK